MLISKIGGVSYTNINVQPKRNLSNQKKNISNYQYPYVMKNINFGWCTPHIGAMNTLNEKFAASINSIIADKTGLYYELTNRKNLAYSLMDNANAKAAQLLSNYCNLQFTVSEMLPTYALFQSKKLEEVLSKLENLNNPVDLLITINNVSKLNMTAGIDKNTSKEYTQEQLNKAKSGTQLYTTVMLMNILKKKNIEDDSCRIKVDELTDILMRRINEIYGDGAYERIMELSMIGNNPTIEQKKASVALISEFDKKAHELNLPDEFEKKLTELINEQNIKQNRTVANTGSGVKSNISIKLAYHTHPHIHGDAAHEEHHTHPHVHDGHNHADHPKFATEEEHLRYHQMLEEQKKLQELKKQNG